MTSRPDAHEPAGPRAVDSLVQSAWNRRVRLVTGVPGYPDSPPYGPGENYPEFKSTSRARQSCAANPVYDGVRSAMLGMGLDSDNFGKPTWNPLGALVPWGGRVTIKSNMVRHWNENSRGTWQSVVSHWSVIPRLADSPLQTSVDGVAPRLDCACEPVRDGTRERGNLVNSA